MREQVNVTPATLYGSALNATTFNAAISAIGSNSRVLLLTPGTWVLNTAVTVPRNITLWVPHGTFVDATSNPLTVHGPLAPQPDVLWYTGNVTLTYPQSATAIPSHVLADCLPTPPGSGLTIPTFPCAGVVHDGPTVWPVVQVTSPMTLPNSPTVWLALHRSTTATVAGWSRQAGTHYLYQASATRPTNPTGGLVFARALVSGGNITGVQPFAFRSLDDALQNRHSVTSWGAVADGSTDISLAMSRANTAAAVLGSVIAVYFEGAGTYAIGTSVTLTQPVIIDPGATLRVVNAGDTLFLQGALQAGDYQIFDANEVTSGKVRIQTPRELYARWWGLHGVAEVDVTRELQAAINALSYVLFTQPCLIVGPGFHRLTSTINMTTGAGIGAHTGKTFDHQSVCVKGIGRHIHTRFLGETGATPVFDLTGTFYAQLSDFTIGSDRDINNATIGILLAASATTDGAHLARIQNVVIDLKDNATANGSIGSIGILSYGAENTHWVDVQSIANVALLQSSVRNVGDAFGSGVGSYTIASQFVQVQTVHSSGVNTYTNFMAQAVDNRNGTICLYGVNTISFHNLYVGRTTFGSGVGTIKKAFRMAGDIDTLTLVATVEDYNQLVEWGGNVKNAHIRATASIGAMNPWFEVGRSGGAAVALANIDARVGNKANTNDVGFTTPMTSGLVPHSIVNSTFLFDSITQHESALPPPNLLRNTNGSRFGVAETFVEVDLNRQRLYVPWKQLGAVSGTAIQAGVAQIVMPALVTNQNGMSWALALEGAFTMGEPTTPGQSLVAMPGRLGVIRSATAVDTTTGSSGAAGVQVVSLGGGFSNANYIMVPIGGSPPTAYDIGVQVDIGTNLAWGWTGWLELLYSTPGAQVPVLRLHPGP